ncbi:NmrA family NAD(P)-binding protein [Streptomyces sp. NPDC005303]|uniref:NmrA family NAD(P)-binding protein n=1 Tax=Streptomyces sp. NPDC005303 TaxID=3155713 RepID=UPI0033A238DB
MRVSVFGATGAIGRLVVQRLLDDDHEVTALPMKRVICRASMICTTERVPSVTWTVSGTGRAR